MIEEDIDLFAGPGGWDEGIAKLGVRPLGIEHNETASATATSAGHRRLVADVTKLNPMDFGPVRRIIGSPPCPGWTVAGSGGARRDAGRVLDLLRYVRTLHELTQLIEHFGPKMEHPETLLALEPLRWTLATRPETLAWEQVREVQPLWAVCAKVLERNGYSTATAVLSAEQYGVPQTRRRAILVARRGDFTSQHGPARLPRPTHSKYHQHRPERLDFGVSPWVSMGRALGEEYRGLVLRSNYGTGGDPRNRGLRLSDQPAPTVTGRVNRNKWVTSDGERNVSVVEASLLQTFPTDYPWHGTQTEVFQQIGDAVPPLLAEAIVSEVANLSIQPEERAA